MSFFITTLPESLVGSAEPPCWERRSWPRAWLSVLAMLLWSLSGCDYEQELLTTYGTLNGPGRQSINGTLALASMFEQAGHQVRVASALTPRLNEECDILVWFPSSYDSPSDEVVDWLEDWLYAKPNRLLIYVDRDYDATEDYWRAVAADAPVAERAELERRAQRAAQEFSRVRSAAKANDHETPWFYSKARLKHRVTTLYSPSKWVKEIDDSQTQITLYSSLDFTDYVYPLLAADEDDEDILVASLPYNQSQLWVVANGSFLLNFGLVNHEHRKLANRLIAEAATQPKQVVFLQSDGTGPPIRESDVQETEPGLGAVFGVEPFATILLQLAAVGVIFCLMRFPIFGRPRQLRATRQTDFGRHIEAVGELLQRCDDRRFAQQRLDIYHQRISRSSDSE